jgi:ketosteroid isomerase-like protein
MSAGSEALKERVRGILTAYGQGELDELRAALDPDVVYSSHAPKELFRWGGRHEGIVNGVAALSAIASDYAVHRYEVTEVIGEGDVVWVTADLEATERRSKIRVETQLVTRWQFKGDSVVAVDEYYDNGSVALKLGLAKASSSGQ